MHAKIKLGDLRPNPFKKEVLRGKLQESKIARLRESIKELGFWENVVVRHIVANVYELGYGHHRVEAAIRQLGKDHVVTLPVMDLNDSQMLRMMAVENATVETPTVEQQVDVVLFARKWLKEHPENCNIYPDGRVLSAKGATRKHEHGSTECVSQFLGEINWSRSEVAGLFELANHLEPIILKRLDARSEKPGQIGQAAGIAISKLAKPAQHKAVEVLAKAPVYVAKQRVEEVVRHVKHLPEVEQESEIERRLKEVVGEGAVVGESNEARADRIAQQFIRLVKNFLSNGELTAIIECREYLDYETRRSLIIGLHRLAERLFKCAELLDERPTPKLVARR